MKLQVMMAAAMAIFMTVVATNFIFGGDYAYHGVLLEPAIPAADFTLLDVKNDQPFHFKSERGRITLLYFGYTQCPDVCPTTMGVWQQVKQGLGPAAEQVDFIFITVDPQRDTPEILANYMSVFDEAFTGLGGQAEPVSEVIKDYGIFVEREYYDQNETTEIYSVNHSASTFLVDSNSALRVRYPFDTPAEDILADVQHLLNE